MTLVYGGNIWSDPSVPTRFEPMQSVDQAYVRLAFDAAYTEEGVEKHVVIAKLFPREPSTHTCHACWVLVGGAVFRKEAELWVVDAFNPVLGNGGGFGGSAQYSLYSAGKQRRGLLQTDRDNAGGWETYRLNLFLTVDGAFENRLKIEFTGPGPGACWAPAQSIHFRPIDIDSDAELWDVGVSTLYNDGPCNELEYPTSLPRGVGEPVPLFEGTSCHLHERYRFANARYEVSQTVVKQCAVWPKVATLPGMRALRDNAPAR